MIQASVNGKTPLNLEVDKRNAASGTVNGTAYHLDLNISSKNSFHVISNNKSYNVELLERFDSEKKYAVLVNGTKYEVSLKDDLDLLLESMGIGGASAKQAKEVKAPMPGLVFNILVQEGAEVKKGDTLMILEAMKMENAIKSPSDGIVKKIAVSKGVAVEKNEVLISFV